MSFEADLANLLLADAAITGRVASFGVLKCIWPGIRPEGSGVPCVVTTVVSDAPVVDLDGEDYSGGGLVFIRLQIDSYALTYDAASALATAVRAAMNTGAATIESVPLEGGGEYFYETDTKLHRIMREFEVAYTPG